MLTSQDFRNRQEQRIEELRHRLQTSTSPEEREAILQTLQLLDALLSHY